MLKSNASWIYDLKPFPVASSFTAILVFICYAFYSYHQLNFWCSFNTQFYETSSFLSDYIFSKAMPKQYAFIGYAIVPTLSIAILISALYNEGKYQGIRYLLAWVGIRIFPILRVLVELNVVIASIFIIVDYYSTIIFLLAVIINFVLTFLLQNYSNSKDHLNCHSLTFIMIAKICFYLNCLMNSIGLWYASQSMANIILSARLVVDIVLFISYFFYGITLYSHSLSKILMGALVVIHFSLTFGQWADQMFYLTLLYDAVNDLVLSLIFFIVLAPLTFSAFCHIFNKAFQQSNKNIKKKCLFLKYLSSNFSTNIQDQCLVRGLILHHIKSDCQNPLCFCHNQLFYSSKKNKYCDIKKISLNKSVFINSLMKCWYETSNNQTLSFKIDYIEHVFNKFRNTFQSMFFIEQCKNKFQFPFDKLRLVRLKEEIIKQNKRINKQLYNGELDIQFIVQSQKRYQHIKTLMNGVLKRNLQFWQTIHHNNIDLTELLNTVNPNFQIIEQINDNFKQLSKYFDVQKKWKFCYAWFTLYVRNEKLKPVLLEFFTNQVKEDYLFSDNENQYQHDEMSISKIIFETDSAVIHINNKLENPIIKKVNSYFPKLLGYTQSQIIESPLQILMTDSIAKIHPQVLHNWAYQGKSNSQPNYSVNKIYVKHKYGHLIAVNKYVKQFIAQKNQLQYIALFKTQKENDLVMLVDQNMNTEGMTKQLFDKLNFKNLWFQQLEIKNLNMLLLMPKLVTHSQFNSLVTPNLTDIFEIEIQGNKSQKLVRKQSAMPFIVSSDKYVDNSILGEQTQNKKQIILKSQLKVPSNIKSLMQQLTSQNFSSKNLEQRFNILKELIQKKSPEYCFEFSCQVEIIIKSFKNTIYYEIHFNQLSNLSHIIYNHFISGHRRSSLYKTNFNTEDFYKFFQSKQNGKVYSLQASNNIFIKQDNNKPVDKLRYIQQMNRNYGYFFLAFMVLNLIVYFYNSFVSFTDYDKYGQKLLVMNNYQLYFTYYESNTYNFHHYNQNQLEPKFMNQQFFNESAQILFSTAKRIDQLKQSKVLKQSIFDEKINQKHQYSVSTQYKGRWAADVIPLLYDQAYLYIKMFQIAQNIARFPLKTANFYVQWYLGYYQVYLTPGLISLAQKSQINIYKILGEMNTKVQRSTIILLVALGASILLGIVMGVFYIRKIIVSCVSIVDVFTQFNQQDILKIYNYSRFLVTFFYYLKRKDKQQKAIIKDNQSLNIVSKGDLQNLQFNGNFHEVQNNNININKKIKKVEIGSVLNKFVIKTYILLFICILLFFGGCFYNIIIVKIRNQSIETLYETGNMHFKYYSTITNIQNAVQKKYLNTDQYNSYFSQFYVNFTKQILEFKMNNTRISQTSQGFQFTKKYNSAYFEDVCTKFSFALKGKDDVAKCLLVSENALRYGIQSFVYYFTDQALNYLNGTISLSYDTIYKFQQGLKYVNIFMIELADIWYSQYSQVIQYYKDQLLITTMIILASLICVYLVFFQIMLIRNLNYQYESLRRVYNMYMPDYLVTKQKIIKAKLIKDGIIHR